MTSDSQMQMVMLLLKQRRAASANVKRTDGTPTASQAGA